MVSVSYTDFLNVMNLSEDDDITAANTENLLDFAIDCINLYASQSIANMAGVAGSKTVTLSSAQRGAVFMWARALYYSAYKEQFMSSVGGMSITPVDIMANPTMERWLRLACKQLVGFVIKRTV